METGMTKVLKVMELITLVKTNGTSQCRDNAQRHPNRQTIVCTYPRCGLKGHKER